MSAVGVRQYTGDKQSGEVSVLWYLTSHMEDVWTR